MHKWALRDTNPGAYAVRVACYSCGVRKQLTYMTADLNGPAFLAYYCDDCRAKEDEKNQA